MPGLESKLLREPRAVNVGCVEKIACKSFVFFQLRFHCCTSCGARVKASDDRRARLWISRRVGLRASRVAPVVRKLLSPSK